MPHVQSKQWIRMWLLNLKCALLPRACKEKCALFHLRSSPNHPAIFHFPTSHSLLWGQAVPLMLNLVSQWIITATLHLLQWPPTSWMKEACCAPSHFSLKFGFIYKSFTFSVCLFMQGTMDWKEEGEWQRGCPWFLRIFGIVLFNYVPVSFQSDQQKPGQNFKQSFSFWRFLTDQVQPTSLGLMTTTERVLGLVHSQILCLWATGRCLYPKDICQWQQPTVIFAKLFTLTIPFSGILRHFPVKVRFFTVNIYAMEKFGGGGSEEINKN